MKSGDQSTPSYGTGKCQHNYNQITNCSHVLTLPFTCAGVTPALIKCHPDVSVPSGSAGLISPCLVIFRCECGHKTSMQFVSCLVVSRRSEGFQLALSLYLCVLWRLLQARGSPVSHRCVNTAARQRFNQTLNHRRSHHRISSPEVRGHHFLPLIRVLSHTLYTVRIRDVKPTDTQTGEHGAAEADG